MGLIFTKMKGVYCLIIQIKKKIVLKIGKWGRIIFDKGNYVYVGSAQNSIENRLRRHFKKKKKKHWHIDYLLANKEAVVKKAVYKKARKIEECKIAYILSRFEEPVKGFGCSDCKCQSHLFRLKSLRNIKKLDMIKI
jgi:Uri superfamily endonuclease